jgi:lipopolysaccharide/colanic/teichoic acid biosynthesis glycosyltransferase
MILLLPIILIVILVLIITNQRPFLFIQQRPGNQEKIFSLYKFATMTNDKDFNGNLLSDEERLTKVGKFLRKTSIDELPQLFNVLKGDMSIVGPRPLLIEYLEKYDNEQKLRHTVKPGITGYAQVKGRNNITWQQKLAYDTYYSKNINFNLDLKILFLTAKTIFDSESVSKNGFATSDKFLGNE